MRIIGVLLIGALAACSGTGGTMGGLLPAPKFLKGSVEGQLYVAPGRAFSVQLPHPPTGSHSDKNEWTYTKVHEIEDGPVVGVVLGPAAFDLNQYHAVLIRIPMQENKAAQVNGLFQSKVARRQGSFEQRTRQEIQVNGRTCYYGVYESADAYLVLSLTDAGNSFFAVEADISKKSTKGHQPADAQALVDRTWPVFNTMLETFSIGQGT